MTEEMAKVKEEKAKEKRGLCKGRDGQIGEMAKVKEEKAKEKEERAV